MITSFIIYILGIPEEGVKLAFLLPLKMKMAYGSSVPTGVILSVQIVFATLLPKSQPRQSMMCVHSLWSPGLRFAQILVNHDRVTAVPRKNRSDGAARS